MNKGYISVRPETGESGLHKSFVEALCKGMDCSKEDLYKYFPHLQ